MSDNPLEPSPETEQKIRDRAYYLWEADGCPAGRPDEYWERARELQAMADSAGAGELPNPMTQRRDPSADRPIEEADIQENLGEFPHGALRDQGDRMETPKTRRKAAALPKMGDKEIQDSPRKPAPTGPEAAAPKRKKK